jgi:alpha-L-arabinofuranosidase
MKSVANDPFGHSTCLYKRGLKNVLVFVLCGTMGIALAAAAQETNSAQVMLHTDRPAKPISPVLFGIFFEDLNYAADGGLYAQLIQNGSFEYSAVDSPDWSSLSFWQFVATGGAKGGLMVQDANPLSVNNPNYAVLRCDGNGEVGMANGGFDGIAVKAGETYDFSVFARRRPNENGPLHVRLEGADGTVLTQADLPEFTTDWTKYTTSLVPGKSDPNARIVLSTSGRGMVFLDMVSLFPHKTFHDRPNGLRADLAQTIADLGPKFVRFPGGCLAHGDGVKNIYRWKDTIGPVEQRKQQKNIWRYHQSMGLGYFEYFQFCEDIGATPLPIVAAGVSCQNSDFAHGTGQQCIPMDQMPAYVQDILDLIEYANGPATSTWGAKRAAAGHPEPFTLQYLGIGNEDAITPGFKERFKMLFDAVRQKHPEITVIGTVGPSPKGTDFDEGWKIATALTVPIVDEHYYMQPDWFLKNLARYDGYDRGKSKVYLGEYASWGNTLRNALAEAVYMTSLERNGDVVHMASYAPLLCKSGHVQWYPDMIYFNNSQVFPSINYYAQQMFLANQGDQYVSSDVKLSRETPEGQSVAISCVRDGADLILKIVNLAPAKLNAQIQIAGEESFESEAECTVLAGEDRLTNPGDPRAKGNIAESPIKPVASQVKVGKTFEYDAPAYSLTVLRLRISK